jgi:RNA polymerase sigma factor (sigma-70 family)
MPNGPTGLVLRHVRQFPEAPGAGDLTDRELVERFAGGDGEAFAVLVRRHGAMVLGVCRRILGHEHDAEDAFQAVFLVLSRKAAALRRKEAVGPWLFGVAHRLALRARQKGRQRREREARLAERVPAEGPDELTLREARAALDEELAQLPERDRGPLILCYLEGLTRDEAAARLGCPLGTLKSRLERARAVLQKRLARRGLGLPATLSALLLAGGSTAGVPPALFTDTIKVASLFAAGRAATGAIPVRAVALAEGVLETMTLTKLKIALGVLAVVAVLGASAAALTQQVPTDKPADPPAKEKPVAAVKPAEPPVTPEEAPDEEPADPPAAPKTEAATLPTTVTGVVVAVDTAKNTVTVAHREGETTFSLTGDCKIEIDLKLGTLASLPKGANVMLSQFVDPTTARNLQAGGRWYFGAAVKAVDARQNTITIADKEGDKTFAVAPDVCVAVDAKPCRLDGVPVGAIANFGLRVDQTTVCVIGAEGPNLGGCGGSPVKAVDVENRTITFDDKAPADVAGKTFTVAKDANIQIDGKPGALSEVPVGSYVNLLLTVDRQTVRQVIVHGPPFPGDCGGSLVKAVDAERGTITFDDKARAEVAGRTFGVATGANILIDGKPGKLTDVPAGAYVSLILAVDGQTARQVNAQGPSNVCDCGGSLVKAVDAQRGTITFDDKARAEVAGKTFALAKDAFILIDGKTGKLAELPPGSLVNLTLSVDRRRVCQMNANGRAVSGVLRAVDAGASTVHVGDTTYAVAKDALIVIDGKQASLGALPAGVSVNVNLRVDQQTVGMIQTAR